MWRALLCLALLASACSDGDDDATRRRSTSTSVSSSTTTTVAPTTTTDPTGCPVPARTEPDPRRPRYTLAIDARLGENRILGQQDIRFTPDLATDRVLLRLWPNGPRPASAGARLAVSDATVDGRAVAVERPEPTVLVLRQSLAAGQPAMIALGWQLTLPGSVNDRLSRQGDAVRLGSFFPILPWEPGLGWATEPPTSGFAEASTAPTADFDVTVTVPEGLSVLATGVPDGTRWRAQAVRDFALSIGRFRTVSGRAAAPGPVEVTVGVAAGVEGEPAAYLAQVTRALTDFGRRYGTYPWPAFSLAVTPDLNGGIEYPMHVMQGPGTLGRTVSHELGHQWFYGLVGSNQGRDPWLDEGLATLAESRIEGPSVLQRSIPAAGRGRAGQPMTYWEERQSIYYRSVYVQGAVAVNALGPADRVDCALRIYVARNAHRIARDGDFLSAVSTVVPNAQALLQVFGVLSEP